MAVKTQLVTVNIGPQHPSTHGVLRLLVTLDGEVIVDLKPVFGYLHRGKEKLAEARTYSQFVPITDRQDYLASMTNNWAYCLAVERLAGIELPERAEYIRVLVGEMMRISNHLMAIGFFLNDCGAWFTPLFYMYREREKLLDLFDMLCGQRLNYNYMRLGGLSQDLPPEFLPALKKFVAEMPGHIDEYEQLLATNEIVLARSKGVGILPAELAINASASGPVLRASGVKWDIRRADPYSLYPRLEFEIPTGLQGDTYDRMWVRFLEMRQSLRILQQAIAAVEQMAPGVYRANVPKLVRPPKGEIYSRIESPKGELGYYIVSDGGVSPWRCRIRGPSQINLTALRDMVVGWKLADLIIIFGSIDIVMGEVDR